MIALEIIPAIDLMDSKVVRLKQGKTTERFDYEIGKSAIEIASEWIREGAKTLHIIDLDRALGVGSNLTLIHNLMENLDISFQIGGGLRKPDDVKDILDIPQTTVMIGTLALQDPDAVSNLVIDYGADRIMVALDYRAGVVLTKGWTQSGDVRLDSALDRFLRLGIESFLLTSVDRDGMLCGPDLDTLAREAGREGIRITAAGGISSLPDIELLGATGVVASVLGRALYEKVFSLQEAIELAREMDCNGT
ncbi:MAG: HisA/HisF-related TIM barrel protein [Candidatus Thorarchaeota archaeon]